MTALALLLIVMSALMHAAWNYLTKGSRGTQPHTSHLPPTMRAVAAGGSIVACTRCEMY